MKGQSFWKVRLPSKPSWTWRKILQVREQCRTLFTVKIGNGRATSLWYDYWLREGKRPVNILTIRHLTSSGHRWDAKVSDIMEGGRWNITDGSASMLEKWDKIPSYPPNTDVEDQVIWRPNPRGIFSIASAWEATRNHHPPSDTHLIV